MQYIDISLSFKRRMLKDNLIKDFLRDQGYYFIQFGSMWPFTYYNKYADENINIGFLSPYQATLWEMSIFSPINKKFNLFDDLRIRKLQWAREKYQLSKLAEIPRRNEPTFVFAHMGITHTPYVFDSDGNFITKEEVGKKSTLENYLNQIRYTNKQIKILVDEILNKSPREPIIIIQSDHGLRLDLKAKEELSKENLLPDEEGINRLAHGILNAYYFPDGGDKILYDSISPVNTFRVLLNYYFNQKFALFGDE